MGKRVLIVDDAYFMRNLIKKALREAGYEIAGEAKNGSEGVSLYFELKPDIVTMDINMPDISGIEATQQIMMNDPNANIIAVTGSDNDEVKDAILSAGAKGFLKKPFQPAFLLSKIEDMFIIPQDEAVQPVLDSIEQDTEQVDDFFEDQEIDLLNKPDENRESLLVIENQEDRIMFPEDLSAKEKFALVDNNSITALNHQESLESVLSNKIQEEEISQDEERSSFTETINIVSLDQEEKNDIPEPKSYLEIRPPRGKVLTDPVLHQQDSIASEDMDTLIINASEDEQNKSSHKKGILAFIFNLFKIK
ncbi:response regulator [Paenibacillus thiaminolyticus]|uniref:response regulator n=1 Tax=Paenibacillus thiaminolyticus TaxID=49283 RepID=UPI00232A8BE9|nr:response regulator [Paenibacillus thiaminolyticus]